MFRLTDVVDSRCGLHCSMCEHNTSDKCHGCMETNSGLRDKCPVAACCEAKGYEHCGECEQLPCAMLAELSSGDVPRGARIEQCRRWARVKMRKLNLV